MEVGLIDIDGHAQKKKWGATIYPNLALGKLARWHRLNNDTVVWARPYDLFNTQAYDTIYASKIFNFTDDVDWSLFSAREIIKGGTGYDITSKLPDDVDRLQPDYSIFPNVPKDTAYGFLTRGCPNKCKWCVVPTKEGLVYAYMDCEEIAIEGRTKLVLMDNNILASGDYGKSQLEKIARNGYQIDFNQAMDARLMTDEWARLMVKCRWIDRRIRFGCDTTQQIEHCERAIDMLKGYGYKGEFFLYTMIGGGKNDIDECYSRIHYWWKRNHDIRERHLGGNIYPYAQPYRDPNNPNHIIPQWQKDMARWCNKHMIFQLTDFMEFSPRKNFKCNQHFM